VRCWRATAPTADEGEKALMGYYEPGRKRYYAAIYNAPGGHRISPFFNSIESVKEHLKKIGGEFESLPRPYYIAAFAWAKPPIRRRRKEPKR